MKNPASTLPVNLNFPAVCNLSVYRKESTLLLSVSGLVQFIYFFSERSLNELEHINKKKKNYKKRLVQRNRTNKLLNQLF